MAMPKARSLRQREFVALIGAEPTRSLVAAFGGTRLYIPTVNRLRPGHKLVGVVGWEAAELLCREYGGIGDLKIPTCRAGCHRLDRRKVVRLRARATPVSRIALHVRCTEKAVYAILKRLREGQQEGAQLDWTFWV